VRRERAVRTGSLAMITNATTSIMATESYDMDV
jgi:hypothetical protein